jgi:hypothetical protein
VLQSGSLDTIDKLFAEGTLTSSSGISSASERPAPH